MATPQTDAEIERVLIVAAHPDDADFGAAGTLAGFVAQGMDVTLLCVTHGEQGARPDADITTLSALREREQRAASAALGVTDVRFLDGYRDGWLEATFDLQREIVEVIREVRPQRILAQSPERNYDRIFSSHPDHLAAGDATVRAAYPAAENPFAWPDLGLDFWHVGELWLMARPEPNHAVDITDVFDAKVAALREHGSQTGHRGDHLPATLWEWGNKVAARFGLGEDRVAEAFYIVPINAR